MFLLTIDFCIKKILVIFMISVIIVTMTIKRHPKEYKKMQCWLLFSMVILLLIRVIRTECHSEIIKILLLTMTLLVIIMIIISMIRVIIIIMLKRHPGKWKKYC